MALALTCGEKFEHIKPEYQNDWHPVFTSILSSDVLISQSVKAQTSYVKGGIVYSFMVAPKFGADENTYELSVKIESIQKKFFLVLAISDEHYTHGEGRCGVKIVRNEMSENVLNMSSKPRCIKCRVHSFTNEEFGKQCYDVQEETEQLDHYGISFSMATLKFEMELYALKYFSFPLSKKIIEKINNGQNFQSIYNKNVR